MEKEVTTIFTLQRYLENNFELYKPEEYNIIKAFYEEEQDYVDHLETLESQKFELAYINVPYYDLENLFGCITEIKNFHRFELPEYAIKCYTIEDIFNYFLNNKKKLRYYILDQFTKFQVKFYGKKALYKRFYQNNIDYSLTLPERKIISMIKYHSYLKTFDHLKDSIILYNTLNYFQDIYKQMQYVKQLAAIQNISKYICFYYDTLCIDNFNISIDGAPHTNYRVYFLDELILLTTLVQESKLHMHKIEYNIPNNKIQFSGGTPEDMNFEIVEYLENNKKRTYIFTADNASIKSKWVDVIQNVLYKQFIEQKQKAKTP
ncbi:uncharacterized protein [Onthophagus taurus]|uniref:uncharacterized protein n=1 Tax=Onthophagus taurus TaxID=166361 RepID=UPI0039BE6FB0